MSATMLGAAACACGCGKPVRSGARFVRGHNRRGVPALQNASHSGYLRRYALGQLLDNGPMTTTQLLQALPRDRRQYNRYIMLYALTTLEEAGLVARAPRAGWNTPTEWRLTDADHA